jgi:hypothetical protein
MFQPPYRAAVIGRTGRGGARAMRTSVGRGVVNCWRRRFERFSARA